MAAASPASVEFQAFPEALPIFPLCGAVLMPGGELPLNIFEPRYLAMVDAALANGRWLGMVQPRETREQTVSDTHPLFEIGCLGRIVSFSETEDSRYQITISGTVRFAIAAELALHDGFRRVTPDYSDFLGDTHPGELAEDQRHDLFRALRQYLEQNGYDADWKALENTPDNALVASMAMACPLEPAEKQALLEAGDLAARTAFLITMLDMTRPGDNAGHDQLRH